MKGILIRGNSVNDPEAPGYVEVWVAITGIAPRPRYIGEVYKTGINTLIDKADTEIQYRVTCYPFRVRGTPVAGREQSFAVQWRLMRTVFPNYYKWVVAVVEDITDPDGDILKRARFGAADALEDTFWEEEIALPFPFVLDGQPTPQEQYEQGTSELEFNMIQAVV